MQIKLVHNDQTVETIKDIHDMSFMGEIMVMCLNDMETRITRDLRKINNYKIIKD